jgi:hypothetical protein
MVREQKERDVQQLVTASSKWLDVVRRTNACVGIAGGEAFPTRRVRLA